MVKRIEQFKICIQIACLKINFFDKAADSGCHHVNVEEKWRVQLSHNFRFFYLKSQPSLAASNELNVNG